VTAPVPAIGVKKANASTEVLAGLGESVRPSMKKGSGRPPPMSRYLTEPRVLFEMKRTDLSGKEPNDRR
jgi:hypothetical protein